MSTPESPIPEPHPHTIEKAIPEDRIVVVENVYHQTEETNPVMVESRFSKKINSQEQPYTRIMKVGPPLVPVDLGWLKDAPLSMLLLQNASPKGEKGSTVEVCGRTPVADYILPPGESLRVQPVEGFAPLLRCPEGQAKVIVTAYPG